MLQQQKEVFICPSILSADFGDLAKDCAEVIALGANSLHIDVMDGYIISYLDISSPTSQSAPPSSRALEPIFPKPTSTAT